MVVLCHLCKGEVMDIVSGEGYIYLCAKNETVRYEFYICDNCINKDSNETINNVIDHYKRIALYDYVYCIMPDSVKRNSNNSITSKIVYYTTKEIKDY